MPQKFATQECERMDENAAISSICRLRRDLSKGQIEILHWNRHRHTTSQYILFYTVHSAKFYFVLSLRRFSEVNRSLEFEQYKAKIQPSRQHRSPSLDLRMCSKPFCQNKGINLIYFFHFSTLGVIKSTSIMTRRPSERAHTCCIAIES